MRAAKFIWLSAIILVVLITFGFITLHVFSYEHFIIFASDSLSRPDLKDSLHSKYFTLEKFNLIINLSLFIIPVLGIIIYLLIAKCKLIKGAIYEQVKISSYYINAAFNEIKTSSNRTRCALAICLIIITARSIYYATHFYAQFDECWNYNYFLSSSPLTSIVAWNNYPLHNLISLIFIKLLPDTTFVMRIPSILFGLLSTCTVFVIIKKMWRNEILAIIALLIFAALPLNVFYFLFARGVIMAIFFGLILYYFIIVKNLEQKNLFILSIVAALGSYSMVSFPIYIAVIILAALIMQLIDKSFKPKSLIWFSVLSFSLTILFLSLFLVGSGVSIGLQSNYTAYSFSIPSVIDQIYLNAFQFTGTYFGWTIFMLLNIILLATAKKYRSIIIANICILSVEFFLPLFMSTLLPSRALGFQIIAYFFTIIIFLKIIYNKISSKIAWTIGAITVIIFSYISHNHSYLNWSNMADKATFDIAEIFQKNEIKNYYYNTASFGYYVPGILFYHKLNNKNISCATSIKKSTRYQNKVSNNIDAIVVPLNEEKAHKNYPKIIYKHKDFVILTR